MVGDEPSQCKVRNETSLVISLPGVNYPELLATTIVSGAVGR